MSAAMLEPYVPERHFRVEGLNPQTYEGFSIGDKVRFVRDLAEDVKAGNIAVITDLDDHPVFPVTVTVQRPAGQDIKGMPVSLNEIEVAL